MKKISVGALFLIIIAFSASGQELRPNTITSADLTIHTEASGYFYGTVAKNDSLEIQMLQPQSSGTQKITSNESYLEIGGDKIPAKKMAKAGLQYLSFKIDDLLKYSKTPEFKIKNTVRVEKTSAISVGEDYNLSKAITEYAEYKSPSKYAESGDQTLRSKAALEFTSDSWIETTRQISEWVNSNINYDFEGYYSAIYSAKQTYENTAGVCDEFANLTIAFARIKGVPARYVAGISFDGQRFGNHGWAEFYNPKAGWVPVDSTFGETGYVDALHIEYSKSIDANKSGDMVVITSSRHQIEVETSLSEPRVTINSTENFARLTEKNIEMPEKVAPEEIFDINATIRNISGQDGIFPAKLAVHSDFKIERSQRLVYLQAGEAKKITWKATAPEKDTSGSYYTYGVALLSADGNTESKIMLAGKKGETKGEISILDISPEINGDSLKVTIKLENPGKKQQVKVVFSAEGTKPIEMDYEIQGGSQYKIEETLGGIQPGTVEMSIFLPEEKSYKIQVPEKAEEKPIITESGPEEKYPETEPAKISETWAIDWLAIGVAAAGIGAMLVAGSIAAALLLIKRQ